MSGVEQSRAGLSEIPQTRREVHIVPQADFKRSDLVDPRRNESTPLAPWRNAVVYQVMTRSFYDANGDGNGDLQGLIQKADFIKDMGYDAIWLNPIHKSPQKDNGYDVASYYKVDPLYGNNKDLEQFIAEMKQRKVSVYFDLVINHTSDQHPWFRRAKESKGSIVRDVYVWKDGKKAEDGTLLPPNNWLSYMGGPAWTYEEKTGQFYLHKFISEQPDLNLRNPAVAEHVLKKILPRLLRMGISGFRMDTADIYFEDPRYSDAEVNPDYKPGKQREMYSLKQADRYIQQDEVYTYLEKIMDVFDEYGAIGIGEVNSENLAHLQGLYTKGKMHMPFNFNLMRAISAHGANASILKEKWDQYMETLPQGACTSVVYDNHDQYKRLSEKVGENIRSLTLMQMALGDEGGCMKFVYYGDDIGMPSGNITTDTIDDPQGKLQGLRVCRDFSRTPMHWEDTVNGGFSVNPDAKPWLPLGDTAQGKNVKEQIADKGSMLNLTKDAITFYKQQPALLHGKYVPYQTFDDDTMVFGREAKEQQCLALFNFSDKEKLMVLPEGKKKGQMAFSTDCDREKSQVEEKVKLGPHEGCILVITTG